MTNPLVTNQVPEIQYFGNKHQSHEHGRIQWQFGSRISTFGTKEYKF